MEETQLRLIHLPGYLSTLNAGTASIMPSYSSWKGQKMSGHKYLLTTVLKEELGFEGFLISDYNAIEELPGSYKEQIRQSVNAGMDMMMVPSRYKEYMALLKELVEEGGVSMDRIDDAVRRILRVKFAMGLFEDSGKIDPALETEFGSMAHRDVARDAVRQSLVLLKNEGSVLPIARTAAKIVVSGRGADNIGMQCGGWTIKWQGGMGATTEGTSILSALRSAAGESTEVVHLPDGTGAQGPGIAIAVIGEEPYAEFMGDSADISLTAQDIQVVRNLKQAGFKTVLVILSGRPVILEPVLDQVDAIIAAWLPGSEGQGVADVLFGDYKPTGKLSFSWPRTVAQEPVNYGDSNYDPLFPYGFGLTY